MRRSILSLAFLATVSSASVAPAESLPLVLEVQSSKGLQTGDPVLSAGKQVGRVTNVGFGDDMVEVRLAIDADARKSVRRDSVFVVLEGDERAVEHFAGSSSSPLASAGERFRGADALADVWLRRGTITSQELAMAMAEGLDGLRRNIERLKRSPEWPKFRDQIARLAAQMTVAQTDLARVIEETIPALGRELDSAYEEYQRELRKQELQRQHDQ
ncbi:MAG: MlaD protein [Candidatus Binatota bacterium]|jgi:ABC-type transporter Mla subunit MlaD|nr:MlaD protein [Candidatus Binatota bacterium]